MFLCHKCNRHFKVARALEQHTEAVHPTHYTLFEQHLFTAPAYTPPAYIAPHFASPQFFCYPCNKGFASQNALDQHRSSPRHIVECCNSKFPVESPNLLEDHLKSAHPYCVPCSRAFKSDEALQAHLENSSLHITKCQYCTATFPTDDPKALRNHTTSSHAICIPCNRTFVHDQALQNHIDNSSKHVDEFRCCECDSSFKSMRALDAHLRDIGHSKAVAVAKPPNFCEACERQFMSKSAYSMHMASVVHQPIYEELQCTFCEKSFSTASALAQHLESGGCGGGATKEMVDMAVMAADTAGVVVGTGEEVGARGFIEEGETDSEDGDEGGVVFTPGSSRALSRIITPGSRSPTTPRANGSMDLIPLNHLCCYLCPQRGPFVNKLALEQHLASLAHEPKIYHCPTALGGGRPEKQFKTMSGLIQHLEAEACNGGRKTFENSIGFLVGRLREIGFGGVKLIARA